MEESPGNLQRTYSHEDDHDILARDPDLIKQITDESKNFEYENYCTNAIINLDYVIITGNSSDGEYKVYVNLTLGFIAIQL